jgi:hypothetical protein
MVAGRSMHPVDRDLERLWRQHVDVVDIVTVTGRARITATQLDGFLLYCLKLRNGDDDYDGRRGRFSCL